jgi:hypothetical protein
MGGAQEGRSPRWAEPKRGGAPDGRSPRGEAAEPRIREAASPRIPWFFRLTVRVVLVIRTRSIQSVPLSFPTCSEYSGERHLIGYSYVMAELD